MKLRSLTVLLLLLASCTPGNSRGGNPDAGGPLDPVEGPMECDAHYRLRRRQPNVLLALDRGCGMRGAFGGGEASGPRDPNGLWHATREALARHIATESATWGLMLVPDDPTACDDPVLRTLPEPGSGEAIVEELEADGRVDPFVVCSGSAEAPFEGAVRTLVNDDPFTEEKPLMLVVGASAATCGATPATIAEEIPWLTDLGVDVGVVSLSPSSGLRAFADAAGTRGTYFEASSVAELEAALDELLTPRGSCVLELDGPPITSAEGLRIWLDDQEIPGDPDEGFSFDPGGATVALNGSACERLLAGRITEIRGAAGCTGGGVED